MTRMKTAKDTRNTRFTPLSNYVKKFICKVLFFELNWKPVVLLRQLMFGS